jgi:hypothetical protein
MKEEKLKELLERYYNGDTSDEEEFLLRKYFLGNEVFPGYEAEKEIFSYYSGNEEAYAPSDDLEKRIIKSIDAIEGKHTFSRKRLILLSVAASLAILIGSYFFFINRSEPEDSFDDPQIAYVEAKRILFDISVRMNRGTMALQNVARINNAAAAGLESVEKSASLISGQIERIENLGKLLETDDRGK